MMEYQDQFMKPLLKLHKYYDQTQGWSLGDLKEALAMFLTADCQSVNTEVRRPTLDAALDITGYILNYKRHMKRVCQSEVDESAPLQATECFEIINVLFTRLIKLAEYISERTEVTYKQAILNTYLQDLICDSPPKIPVSILNMKL